MNLDNIASFYVLILAAPWLLIALGALAVWAYGKRQRKLHERKVIEETLEEFRQHCSE